MTMNDVLIINATIQQYINDGALVEHLTELLLKSLDNENDQLTWN